MIEVDVSIVMAEYNTPEDDLRQAISSILNQTMKDFEFIIVIDGSKTNVAAIVADFNDDRIKIIKNMKNRGLVYSLNKGIKHAKGRYIVRMDADDVSMPSRVEKIYNFITKHPEYAVVGTKAVEFSGSQEYGILGKAGEKTKKDIMRGDVIIHASAIINKKALTAVGYFKNYSRAEDLVLWCELLLKDYRLYTFDEVLYRYRVNLNDYSKRRLKYRKGELSARFDYYPKLGAGPVEYFRIVKSIVAGLLPARVVQLYRNILVLGAKDGRG